MESGGIRPGVEGVSALETADSLLILARAGDREARDRLIELSRGFILRTASAICRRWLDWRNDDELSVALVAFNEAIDSFRPEERQFYSHARRVITSRLIDHFRSEGRHLHLSMDAAPATETGAGLEVVPALDAHQRSVEAQARLDEIMEYNRLLQGFGLSLADIKEAAPKHRDTRDNLRAAAQALASQPRLIEHLQRTRQLPLVELERVTGLSRKVLETGRRYIVALAILLMHEELTYLRTFAQIATERGVS